MTFWDYLDRHPVLGLVVLTCLLGMARDLVREWRAR